MASCLSVRTQPLTATGAPSQTSTIPYLTIPYHTIPYHTIPYHTMVRRTVLAITNTRAAAAMWPEHTSERKHLRRSVIRPVLPLFACVHYAPNTMVSDWSGAGGNTLVHHAHTCNAPHAVQQRRDPARGRRYSAQNTHAAHTRMSAMQRSLSESEFKRCHRQRGGPTFDAVVPPRVAATTPTNPRNPRQKQ